MSTGISSSSLEQSPSLPFDSPLRINTYKTKSIRWDLSPNDEINTNLHQPHNRFHIIVTAIQASTRLRRLVRLKRRRLHGSPLSRFRSCIYASIAISRLHVTLPAIRARKTKYMHVSMHTFSWHKYRLLHLFRCHAKAVLFICRLTFTLHKKYIQCPPLQFALQTIIEASQIKLDQAINSGKCQVLMQLLRSIGSNLYTMRFVLQNLDGPLQRDGFQGLGAWYQALKDLCRWLLMCKQYIVDSTGQLPSRQVFAKLESANTIKSLLIDLNKCYQVVIVKFEDFLRAICSNPVTREFELDCLPPCLPGLCIGHYLEFQAKKDLEHVLSNLEQQPKSILYKIMNNWKSQLNAAEETALSTLILARLKYNPSEGDEALGFLKNCLYVDKKHIKVVRFLGSGTYGKVEEVTCFGERYAMKTIEGINTLENASEAVIQARIHHPNIVKLIWYTNNFDSENSLSLLMELMDINLQTFIRTRGRVLNYPLVSLHIMMQIAKAMNHLHSKRIMHRDLKAENVLIDLKWRPDAFSEGYIHVKVADFGLAKTKQAGHKNIHTWKVGTKYWRAPEVFWQDASRISNEESSNNWISQEPDQIASSNYSFSADVYSFAMTCYEIVAGKQPFSDCPQTGLKERIVKCGERPPLPHHLHPGLKDLIRQCWDGNPKNRPKFEKICQTLEQIKEELMYGSNL